MKDVGKVYQESIPKNRKIDAKNRFSEGNGIDLAIHQLGGSLASERDLGSYTGLGVVLPKLYVSCFQSEIPNFSRSYSKSLLEADIYLQPIFKCERSPLRHTFYKRF